MGAKVKTHRGAAKRFKVTASGKILRKGSFKSHLLGKKSSNRKRRLSGAKVVHDSDQRRVERMLPNR